MPNSTEHAERELREAGWFDVESPYGGLVGPCVMKMVEQFAEEGHSGGSAPLVVSLFSRLARFGVLNPIKNPMQTGHFHDVSGPSGTPANTTLQSTRLSSLFSEDSGRTWYDIDKPLTWWQRLLARLHLRSHRAYVTFPYLPK